MKYPIYELTPDNFVQLCADLLNAEHNYDKVFIFSANDNGIDIEGLKGITKTGIVIKHKLTFSENSLITQLDVYKTLFEYYHQFIIITSAKIPESIIRKFSTEKIQIYSQEYLIYLLDKHSDVANRYFQNLTEKKRKTKFWLTTSASGLVVSIAASLTTTLSYFNNDDSNKPLETKIANVEQVLIGINGLEKDLESIKEDMIETEIENKRIIAEYEKLKGVENLIDKRKEELSSIINYKPWSTKIYEFLFGTIVGILTSILSSILYDKWKQRKALKE